MADGGGLLEQMMSREEGDGTGDGETATSARSWREHCDTTNEGTEAVVVANEGGGASGVERRNR